MIRHIKESGIRDTPYNKRVYALSGILKCDLCGNPYAGNAGYYRCNAKVKGGRVCSNNAIAQEKAEETIFTLLGEHILKFRSIQPVINAVKQKLGQGIPDQLPLEKRLKQIEKERKRLMTLYKRELMELDEVEQELTVLNDDKKAIHDSIIEMKAHQGMESVDDNTIRSVIETIGKDVKNADPKIRKRAIMTLFQELRIGPKKSSPWTRTITAKGIYIPLTGVLLASPRGFEPLSPA
ncbi:MAG: hypothetical protein HN931_00700 [Desulfobacterales bacterium]|nr:hypothetical protein [Desulfobacterales bacterium]